MSDKFHSCRKSSSTVDIREGTVSEIILAFNCCLSVMSFV